MLPNGAVPSVLHEVLVEMFRNRAELAREVLRECAHLELVGTTAELGSIDLSQVTSTEYRADAVIVLRDENRAPTSAVIVEVQLRADDDKHWTWPVYATALRANLRCPVILLVVAPTTAVAG